MHRYDLEYILETMHRDQEEAEAFDPRERVDRFAHGDRLAQETAEQLEWEGRVLSALDHDL